MNIPTSVNCMEWQLRVKSLLNNLVWWCLQALLAWKLIKKDPFFFRVMHLLPAELMNPGRPHDANGCS